MKKSPTTLLSAISLPILIVLGLTTFAQTPVRAQGSPPDDSVPIYAIQGAGLESPYFKQWVDTYGIVTGVTGNGYYLQDPVGDDNEDSSDGIFVYTQSKPNVNVGECLALERAYVDEYYEKTELSRTKSPQPVDWCGAALPEPVSIGAARLALDPAELFEQVEGMMVRVDDLTGVVQGPTKRFNNGDAEIAFVPSAIAPHLPGGRVFQHEPQNMAALMYVGSGLGIELPDLNWGDTLSFGPEPGTEDAVIGLLDYNFGKYQLLPLPDQDVSGDAIVPGPDSRPRPLAVEPTDGEFTVCSFNLLGLGTGTAQNSDPVEYDEQMAKRALAIAEWLEGCTIIGLQEAGTPEDAENLARLLHEEYGLAYTATAIEGPGTHSFEFPLTNALLTRSDRVEVLDAQLRQGCSKSNYDVKYEPGVCERGTYGLFNRPPLVVDLVVADTVLEGNSVEPYHLTIIDNHWKSKGGDEAVNVVRREAQALHVAALVQEILYNGLVYGEAANVIVLGDLNDYYRSGPVEALRTTVQPPMVHTYDALPDLNRYTYIFNGGSQALDHILVTESMVNDISEIRPVRLNANYAYPAEVNAESVQHSSDHDPILMRLRPGQAAWVGGNLGFGGIEASLVSDAGELIDQAISDDDGEFRLWNVLPGDYSLYLDGLDAILFGEDEIPVEVLPAGNRIENLDVRHAAVELGADAALAMPILTAP